MAVIQGAGRPAWPWLPGEYSFFSLLLGETDDVATCPSLTEDSKLSVGVLEAGRFHLNDPIIDVPRESCCVLGIPAAYTPVGLAGKGAGNPDYDWSFETVNQPSLGGRSINVTRSVFVVGWHLLRLIQKACSGKLLGGSSAMNIMAWNRASRPEYDAWVPFSSAEWSFQSLLPFFDRSENISRVPNPYPGIQPGLAGQEPPAMFTGSSGNVQVIY
jgi:choline dehydrogenase-like flavoprotein